MPPSRPPIEQERHRKAFEVFFSLGDRRTYRMAADKLGVSASTIKLWSRTFGWSQRISERDAEIVRQVSEKSTSDSVADTERNLKMIRAAKNKVIKDILEGKTKSSVGELAKCIKLERELQSQPDPAAPPVSEQPRGQVIIYLPDNGLDPQSRPPVFALPDNGSSPQPEESEVKNNESKG